MTRSQHHGTLWFAAVSLAAGLSVCFGAERVALVIGNGAYEHSRKLENPVRDADAVEVLLKKAGFEVVGVRDGGLEELYEGLLKFRTAAARARVGLVYFAGHGIEIDGKNYLLPVDASLETEAQLHAQTLALQRVLLDMKEIRLPAKLIILDCCRDNPLTRSWMTTRSSNQQGLRAVPEENLPAATMVMYAAAPGKVALDGTDGNSPFTAALVENLGRPGVSAFDAFIAVSDAVSKATGKRQVPWIKFDGAGQTFRLFALVGSGETKPDPVSPKPVAATSPPGSPSPSEPPAPTPEKPRPEMPPEPKWSDGVAGLPSRGYFNNAEVCAGGPFASFNDYSRKEILKQVQAKLKQEGLYRFAIDGVMGPGTQRGLVEWQQKRGIAISGKLDAITAGQFGISGIREMEAPAVAPEVTARSTTNPETGSVSAGRNTLHGDWKGTYKTEMGPSVWMIYPEFKMEVTIDLKKKNLVTRAIGTVYPATKHTITSVDPAGRKLSAKTDVGHRVTVQLGEGGKTAKFHGQYFGGAFQIGAPGRLKEEGKATLSRND